MSAYKVYILWYIQLTLVLLAAIGQETDSMHVVRLKSSLKNNLMISIIYEKYWFHANLSDIK